MHVQPFLQMSVTNERDSAARDLMNVTNERDADVFSDSGQSFTMVNNPPIAGSTVSTKCTTGSFIDMQTGAIIPASRMTEIIDKIDLLQHKLEQGRLIFRDVKKKQVTEMQLYMPAIGRQVEQ